MVRIVSLSSLGAQVHFSGMDCADGIDYSGQEDDLAYQEYLLKQLKPKVVQTVPAKRRSIMKKPKTTT